MERNEEEFKKDLSKNLRKLDFNVHFDEGGKNQVIKGHGRKWRKKPDLVAVRNGDALIIEAKSENEAKLFRCLESYERDEIPEMRKYCREELIAEIGKWYIHIQQALGHLKNIGDGKGEWNLAEDDISNYRRRIPVLAFPTEYKKWVKKAADVLKKERKVENYEIQDLPSSGISLLKLGL